MSAKLAVLLALVFVAGGLWLSNDQGWIDLSPEDDSGFTSGTMSARFLATSDTDRDEIAEAVSTDGHTISYTGDDNFYDGLGDVDLEMEVCNGATDPNARLVDVTIAYVGWTPEGSLRQDIVNRSAFNAFWSVSYSLADVGSPTLQQTQDRASSADWLVGKCDTLSVDFDTSFEAFDDFAPASGPMYLKFTINDVLMTIVFNETV